MRDKLSAVFSVVMEVNVLDSKDEANLALLARPELGITFTKLHCWRLTQYEKCVFLDADTLVVRNCDELFEREELSAAPDVGWPDCFNSGVFVYRPSQQTFASITAFAAAKGSFDGGDQGLLNMYFSDWAHKDISKHLPFIYNMCSTAVYSYLPAFKQFGDDVRIIHFIGITKPWLQYFDTLTGIVQPPVDSVHLQPLLQLWWNIFCEKVHPQLSPVMATSTLAPIWHKFSPIPFESFIPKSPIYAEVQDKTQSDIHLGSADFSEFKDPWENYCVEDNKIEQYYSTIDNSSSISVLNDEYNYLNSVQHICESRPEHNREMYHNQEYNEYNNTPSHTQHYHNQEQYNEFINENEQHSFFHSKDISKDQSDNWQSQCSIEKYIPVHSTPNYYSSESQHQHTDSQYISQSLFENSNKSLSKEVNNQHNRSYVDHQSNHYHMYDNINTKQSIHHEQKNQNFYCNEQINLELTKQKSLNVKLDHDQAVKNNIICQNNLPAIEQNIEQNVEQNENKYITDKQTVTPISTIPYPVSKPCTDFHNVASQSDSHIMEDINNSNAGLAGALAQMTLGEPRSAEQIALEEHMRKQSWEQGHIDYMGRDSFDNIWKKICETLALAPPRLPSPPKETAKVAETTTNKTVESIKSTEAIEQIESTDEVDAKAAQVTTIRTEEQSLVNNVPITDSKTMIPKSAEKDEQAINTISSVTKNGKELSVSEETTINSLKMFEIKSENKAYDTLVDSPTQHSMQISREEVIDPDTLLKQDPRLTTISTVPADTVEIYQIEAAVNTKKIKQSDIKDEIHAKESSTAPEGLIVSPVPIQVAESVLQLEPKDSMPISQIMTQEILSSTATPIHITETKDRTHINGSGSLNNLIQNKNILSLSDTTTMKDIDAAIKLNELQSKSQETQQILPETEQIECTLTETQSTSDLTLTSSIAENVALPEKSPDKSLHQVTESTHKVREIESCPKELIQSIESPSECETTKTSQSQETPVRPSRTKELNVPSTSASKLTVQDSKDQEKVTKKVIKKSVAKSASEKEPIETTEGDISEKKAVKKVVKKVAKKTKPKSEEVLDDGADNSSSSKQKKTVKVVKKSTKISQTSGTDTVAPETSSPSTSITPIPPKRKAKPITKKSDIE
ncbi:glycogenin 1 isoform X2 [Megachile rotundata]|nr:PREDICTED: agglutinin-like protein 5 isoform X2 [Megachile rotundata]XP_012150684.1 PREDICTED: agglutinin-like protein 5 isoform X2 [Megachile rotundata]